MSERRKFSRVIFSGHCTLSEDISGESKMWGTDLLDISLNGALVLRPENWHDEKGTAVRLNLHLQGSDVELVIDGVVFHQEEGLLGIKFLTLGLESISHLKRLIQLNLADEGLLHREISQLINISEE